MRSPAKWVPLLFLLACASSQANLPTPSYVLRLKWTKGKPFELKVSTSISGFENIPSSLAGIKEGTVTFTGTVSLSVKEVGDTGATIQCESGPFQLASGETVLSKALSLQHVDALGVAKESGDYFGPQFPKESVTAGSIWKGTDPFSNLKSIGSKAAASYRLLSVRKVAGRRVGDISFETVAGNGLREGSGKLVVDMATGRLINGVGSYEIADPQAGVGRTLHIAISVVRLP